MMKKLLPVLSLLLGLGAGGGAAIVLAPPGQPVSDAEEGDAAVVTEDGEPIAAPDMEIVKLPNQFVVPVMVSKRVRAVVILTVALEVEQGTGDYVRSIEPKLRDAFLGELFGVAALGGFEDQIISRKALEFVKVALTDRAREMLEQKHASVLVTDMARQDVN